MAVTITTASLPNGFAGQPYEAEVAAEFTDPDTTYAGAELVSGALPPGLELNSDGVISGTPDATGFYEFELQITGDGAGADTAELSITITDLHTIEGFVDLAPFIAGNLSVSNEIDDPDLDAPPTIDGSIDVDSPLTGAIDLSPSLEGSFRDSYSLHGPLRVNVRLVGNIDVTDVSFALRIRPLIVFGVDVKEVADIDAQHVPDNRPFLISASFTGVGGHPLYDAGARPNYIGIRVGASMLFRSPVNREVAFRVRTTAKLETTPVGFLRYEARSSPVWHPFEPWPEKMIRAMAVFSIADPDGAYLFFARIASMFQHEWQESNRGLLALLDPRPGQGLTDEFLPDLAAHYGLPLDRRDSPETQRRKLTDSMRLPRVRGTSAAPLMTFMHEGRRGEVYEVWANPEDSDGFEDPAAAPAAIQQHYQDLIADGSIPELPEIESGYKTADVIVVPHGYFHAVPAAIRFWPTGRLAVVLKDLRGGPLGLEAMSATARQALLDEVVQRLNEVIPAHADVQIVADGMELPMPGAGEPMGEQLGIGDAVQFTTYSYLIDLTPQLTGTIEVS